MSGEPIEDFTRWYRSLTLDERMERACRCLHLNGELAYLCTMCEARQLIDDLLGRIDRGERPDRGSVPQGSAEQVGAPNGDGLVDETATGELPIRTPQDRTT